jgi:hypothetical protein
MVVFDGNSSRISACLILHAAEFAEVGIWLAYKCTPGGGGGNPLAMLSYK